MSGLNARFRMLVAASVVLAWAGTVHAQLINVTGQERFMEGATHSVNPDGSSFDQGPVRIDAPAGDFGNWTDTVTVGGNMSAGGSQGGGWDGLNTITLDAFSMNVGGGGPPMSSGNGTATNVFQMTFEVLSNAGYTLNAGFGCSQDIVLRLTLTGPGGSSLIDQTAVPNGPLTMLTGLAGTLSPGSYTLRLAGSGTLSYDGGTMGGGNGGGAGGSIPVLSFVVAPRVCVADFNHSGSVTVQDIFDFLAAYFSNDAAADVNGVGGVTVQDIFDFLAAYFAGCP